MKINFNLFILILLLPFRGLGQEIKVVDNHEHPVAQAVVSIKYLEEKKYLVFLTDNQGKISLSPILQKIQLVVTHVSYRDYVDTLAAFDTDLVIKLSDKNVPISEVVVTSEYSAITTEESVYKTSVITREQIENQGATTLDDVMSQMLNIRINHDQVLGSGVTMNGLNGQNIKYLVDGVPVIGRLDGNIDVSQLNLNNVQRIEIIQGPMASSYGTDAAGGVINLITRQMVNQKYQAGINLSYENIGHYNADIFSGFNTGKSSIIISGGRNFFDGWSASDTGRWQEWKPKEQFFGNLKYKWSGKKMILGYQLSAFNEKISNKGVPRLSPYFAYAFDEYYKTLRYTNQLTGSYMLNRDLNINSSFSWSYYDRKKNTYRKDLVSLNELLIPGSEEQDTTIMNSYLSRATISYSKPGAVFTYQAGYDFNTEDAAGSRFKNNSKKSGDYAVFASGEYKASERLEIRPAIRLSYNTSYKAPVVPSVSFKYELTSSMQARLSYGKGFRAPGLKERYLYFVDINHNIRGNEYLLPEYSDNFFAAINYGFALSKTKNIIELTGFYNDIRNMITLAQPDPSSSLFTYINLGTFSTHGVSFSDNLTWKSLVAGAGVSYTGRYNIYADSGSFKKYIYSPDFNAKLQYSFTKINLTASAFFKFNGKLPGYKLNSDNTISQFSNDSYKFLDATLRKGFIKNTLFVTAGMKNILNVTSINALTQGSAHNSGSNDQAIGTGRSFIIRVQYNFSR